MYICSDSHIGNPRMDKAGFQRMLLACVAEKEELLCVGDIVDFYMRSWSELMAGNFLTLGNVGAVCKDWVIGNHDADLLPFNGLDVGIRFHYPILERTVDGEKWLITHGHLYGNMGWLFRRLEDMEKTVSFRKFSRWLVKQKMLSTASRSSWNIESVRKELLVEAKKRGASIVIYGHTHSMEDVTVDGVRFINLGSSLGTHQWVEYRKGDFILKGI